MAKRGPKTKLTPELKEKIIKYIAAGNYVKDACQMVGISEFIYYYWKRQGKKAEKKLEEGKKLTDRENELYQLYQSIKKAESTAVMRNVLNIQKAGKDSWTASAWWLERTHFKEWGDKKSVGLKFENPLEIKSGELKKTLIDKLDTIRERMKDRGGGKKKQKK